MSGDSMIRWHRWVDRNPWLPLLHGSDGLSGRRRLLRDAAEWDAAVRRVNRRYRGQQ